MIAKVFDSAGKQVFITRNLVDARLMKANAMDWERVTFNTVKATSNRTFVLLGGMVEITVKAGYSITFEEKNSSIDKRVGEVNLNLIRDLIEV